MDLLKEFLTLSWSRETCIDFKQSIWDESCPSIGQSDITALIVNDAYGGKIMRYSTFDGFHYYNLIDGKSFDLTGNEPAETGEKVSRDTLFYNEKTRKRYKDLLAKTRELLITRDFDEISADEGLNKYKSYLNQFYMFCDFDVDEYYSDPDAEYARFELAAQNTGLIINAKHDLKTDEYSCSIDPSVMPIPTEFLYSVFNVARTYRENIELEKSLTKAHVNSMFY